MTLKTKNLRATTRCSSIIEFERRKLRALMLRDGRKCSIGRAKFEIGIHTLINVMQQKFYVA